MTRVNGNPNENNNASSNRVSPMKSLGMIPTKSKLTAPTPSVLIDIRDDQLRRQLIGGLPFSTLSPTAKRDKDQIMDSYLVSVNEIQKRRKEFEEFIEAICAVNVEVRVEDGQPHHSLNQQLVARHVGNMVANAGIGALPCRNELTARLAAHSVEELSDELSAALSRAASKVIAELRDSVLSLMQQQVVGQIVWHADDICEFTFNREVLKQEVDREQREVQTQLYLMDGTPLAQDDPEQKRRQVDTTIATHSLEIQYASAQHEHHIVHAKASAIGDTTLFIPGNVRHFIAKTPAFLRPYLQVVEGKMIKEEIIERDRQRENHRVKEVERIETRVLPAAWRHQWCPAVVLGNVVLTGWSPSEAAAEQKQLEQQNRQATLKGTEDDSFILSGVAFAAAIGCCCLATDPAIALIGRGLIGVGSWFGAKALWARFNRG